MDSVRTEALIARLRGAGWDIAPNAYKHEFAGIYVMAGTDVGTVFVDKGTAQINLDLARRIAANLEQINGISNITIGSQSRLGDITVSFRCAEFTGSWTAR